MEACYTCDIAWEERYSGKNCPLCEAKAKIEELQQEVERLNEYDTD